MAGDGQRAQRRGRRMSDDGQTQQVAAAGESEAFKLGLARRNRIIGPAGNQRRRLLQALHPDLERMLIEYCWGTVLERPGLSERDRELITISVLLALGRDREATTHLNGALNVGITKDEIVEVLIQLGVYAGFPATMTGAALLGEVLQARGELTLEDEPS
jgi:4-carboxymuconolactone decarboxylase